MAARYFVHLDEGDEGGRHEVSDVGRMVTLMRQPRYRFGEFFVNTFSGIKIKYDTYTGDVSPVSTEERVWITYVFSTSAFQAIVAPVKEAISLLAKMELLLELAGRDISIAAIVKQRHGQPTHLVNVSLAEVEKTYRQIARLVSPGNDSVFPFGLFARQKTQIQPPVHQAIHLAFKQHDFYEIDSQHDVKKVVDQIDSHQHRDQMPRQTRA